MAELVKMAAGYHARLERIRCGPDQWGNQIMMQLAEPILREDRADLVEVSEHAGWWMTFGLDERGWIVCMGSAACSSNTRSAEQIRETLRTKYPA